MISEKKLLEGAEDDIKSLSVINRRYWKAPRYEKLKKFCLGSKNILSVGCGPKEPIILGSSHALDLCSISETYLRRAGWEGSFKIGSCTSLPYEDKSFEVVVCSEVIEHLPTFQDVIQTFREVARVGKRWIITTPNSDVIKPANQNKHHLQFFTLDKIKDLREHFISSDPSILFKVSTNDHHIYMESLDGE